MLEARIESMQRRATRAKVYRWSMPEGRSWSADPYETATRLEEVQFQLQSLYAVTVKYVLTVIGELPMMIVALGFFSGRSQLSRGIWRRCADQRSG